MFQFPAKLSTLDLSTEAGLQAYLVESPFAAKSIVRVSGGGSAYTFRVVLATQYDTKDSIILKHTRDYAALSKDIPLNVQRMVCIMPPD